MSKNHDAWDSIFENLAILEGVDRVGYFDISADDIKKYGKREPRLMTKVDFEDVAPKVMKDNKLSILAISNGLYRIARTNPFINISKIQNKEKLIKMPSGYITLDPFDISSESAALDITHVSGILNQVFDDDVDLTIRGRLRKGTDFSFNLGKVVYPINGVQIEVDGGYEGAHSINLVEAKIGAPSTISIRQLLYPELAWKRITSEKKTIRSYLFIYEEPFFRFIPFSIGSNGYTLESENERVFKFIGDEDYDIMSIPLSRHPDMDFSAPFPQADSFDKILIMLRKIHSYGGVIEKNILLELMSEYQLSIRQIDYYGNCLKLFRLISIEKGVVSITNKGKNILQLRAKEQAFELAKILFSEEIFHTALHSGVDSFDVRLFSKYGKDKDDISESTIHRRKQTLRKWVDWFKAMFSEN